MQINITIIAVIIKAFFLTFVFSFSVALYAITRKIATTKVVHNNKTLLIDEILFMMSGNRIIDKTTIHFSFVVILFLFEVVDKFSIESIKGLKI